MKNSRKMGGLLVMLIAFAFCFLAEPVKADDRTALDGIYVEDISVGGMTEEQITQAVNDKIEQLKPSVINLSAGEQNAQVISDFPAPTRRWQEKPSQSGRKAMY